MVTGSGRISVVLDRGLACVVFGPCVTLPAKLNEMFGQ